MWFGFQVGLGILLAIVAAFVVLFLVAATVAGYQEDMANYKARPHTWMERNWGWVYAAFFGLFAVFLHYNP